MVSLQTVLYIRNQIFIHGYKLPIKYRFDKLKYLLIQQLQVQQKQYGYKYITLKKII